MHKTFLTLSLISCNLLANNFEQTMREKAYQNLQLIEESSSDNKIETLNREPSMLQQETSKTIHAGKEKAAQEDAAWYNPMDYVYNAIGYIAIESLFYAWGMERIKHPKKLDANFFNEDQKNS